MKQQKKHHRAVCFVPAVLLFLLGAAVYVFPFVNRAATARNTDTVLESFRFLRTAYNDAVPAPVPSEDGTPELTQAQRSATQLSDGEKAFYHRGQYRELLEAMRSYNKSIYENHQEGLKDAWSYEEAMFDLRRYGIEESMIGELRIPKMNCDLPLYLGATRYNMAYGAVQLGQTSMPVGGRNTNCVIAGHRGCTNGPYFLYIQNLEIGDKVYIDNLWETLTYRVAEIKVIAPTDIPEILIRDGKDMVTLITCHPYPYNYQRYAVFCERTDNDPPVVIGEKGEIENAEEIMQAQQENEAPDGGKSAGADAVVKDDFIETESALTVWIPVALLLLAVVLGILTSKRFLRRRKKKKSIRMPAKTDQPSVNDK